MKTITKYETAVCGGGFAGIAAALSAARAGRKVVLFEKSYMLGGLGTAGLITIYLPLCDGMGKQVSFGIAEELLRLSIKYGAEDRYPENWLDGVGTKTENDKRFLVQYNAQLFAILAEQLLIEEGVDIMYGSYVVATELSGNRINKLFVENKSGRCEYTVTNVVDATGDCDIAYFAGAPTETFKQGNVLAAWYYYTGKEGLKLKLLGASDVPEEEKNESNKREYLVKKRFLGLDAEEISEMTILSHKALLNDWLKLRESDKTAYPCTIATTPQIRMTRRIVGEYTLLHTEEHKYFPDSIGMISNWKKRGPIYEVPFGTLFSRSVPNLICAGRCVSVGETMWDIMRVIPCCAVTGEAAGLAAALTDDFTTIDLELLQKKLTERGARLHESEL